MTAADVGTDARPSVGETLGASEMIAFCTKTTVIGPHYLRCTCASLLVHEALFELSFSNSFMGLGKEHTKHILLSPGNSIAALSHRHPAPSQVYSTSISNDSRDWAERLKGRFSREAADLVGNKVTSVRHAPCRACSMCGAVCCLSNCS